MGGNPVKLKELVGTEAQEQQCIGFEFLQRLAGKLPEGKVEPPAQAQGSVDQFSQQAFLSSIHRWMALQVAVKQTVGVAALFDALQDFVGARAGVDVFYCLMSGHWNLNVE